MGGAQHGQARLLFPIGQHKLAVLRRSVSGLAKIAKANANGSAGSDGGIQ